MRPYSSKSIGLQRVFRPWQSMTAKLYFVMCRCPRPMRIELRLLTPGIHPPTTPTAPHPQPTIYVRSAAAVAMTLPLPVMGVFVHAESTIFMGLAWRSLADVCTMRRLHPVAPCWLQNRLCVSLKAYE